MNDAELEELELKLEAAHTERLKNFPADATWYDQRHSLYTFRWSRIARWPERGVFGRQMISQGDVVADLGCGDGFFAYHFFAELASKVYCVDRDESALSQGQRLYADPKIEWIRGNVLDLEIPESDVAFAFGVLEELNEDETDDFLLRMLGRTRTFGGSTFLRPSGATSHPSHKRLFKSEAELLAKLRTVWKKAEVWTTYCQGRQDAYWKAMV